MPPIIRDMFRFGVAALITAAVAGFAGALFALVLMAVDRKLPLVLIPILAAVLGGSVGGSYWIMTVTRGVMIRYDRRRRAKQPPRPAADSLS